MCCCDSATEFSQVEQALSWNCSSSAKARAIWLLYCSKQQTAWCKSSLTSRGSTYSEKQESAVRGAEQLSCTLPIMFIDQ